jgi:glycoside/pentoside/hexuronide:cation symporter, GPH family
MSGSQAQALPLRTILIFSLSNLPVAAINVILFVYLPPYLAGHVGLSLGVIAVVWFSVRAVDLGIDLLLGHLMDRTDTRFGRYRVWMAAGAPVFMLATYMLFMAEPGIGGTYFFVWLFVIYLANSMLYLAQYAWSATLAPDYGERSRVFGVSAAVGVVSTVASLLIAVAAPALGLSDVGSVHAMGWAIIVMVPLGVGLAVWLTPERVNRSAAQSFSLKDYWAIATKPEIVRLFLAQVALTLGPGWMSALYIFYFHDVKGFDQAQASELLLVYVLIGVAGAPLTAMLTRRIGKHRTLMATTAAFSLAVLTIPLLPRGELLLFVPGMAWCGFMAAGFGMVINAMMADVGDEIRLHQGRERISLLYALLSIASKLTTALSIGLSLPLLEWFGYVAKEGAHNTAQAIHALEWIFVTGPVLFVAMGGVCVWGWRLTAARHAEIRAALDARDAATDEAPVLAGLSATIPHVALAAEERVE